MIPFVTTIQQAILLTLGFLFQYALDSTDGILARLRKESSAVGEWLDHSLDGLRIIILHVAILVMFYNEYDSIQPIHLIAFSLSLISMAGNFIVNQLKVCVIGARTGDLLRELRGFRAFVSKIIFLPADFGVYYLIFGIIYSDIFIYVYLIWGVYFSVIFLANIIITFLTPPQV